MASAVAIVTGASRGIGEAIARRLSKDGFNIALIDLPSQKPALEALHREISISGRRVYIHTADVSKESQVKKMIGDTIQTLGGLHVVRLQNLQRSVSELTSSRWWQTQEFYALPGQTFVITSRLFPSTSVHIQYSGNCR